MAKEIIFKSKTLTKPGKRYVRKAIGSDVFYRYCIQSAEDKRFDIEQGIVTADELPADILAKCEQHKGTFYACEWPL